MPFLINALVAALSTGAVAAPQEPSKAQAQRDTAVRAARDSVLAFKGMTVIDVQNGKLRRDQVVIVVGNRIQVVGPTNRVRVPGGARTIQADGTFMVPGFWDMHTHLFGLVRHLAPFLIANGITGIREMSTYVLDSTLSWRRAILAGHMVGPRLVTPGPAIFSAEDNGYPWGVSPATPAAARRVVDSLKAAGVDFIKPYDGLDPAIAFAVADEAKRVGLPLAGHQVVASAAESSELGERSVEHVLKCNDRSPAASPLTGTPLDPNACATLADIFRKNGTWYGIGPLAFTLPLQDACVISCNRYYPYDRFRYLLGQHDSLYNAGIDTIEPTPVRSCGATCSLEAWARTARGETRPEFDFINRPRRAGVRLLLGSDGWVMQGRDGWPASTPGADIHGMMWFLVSMGATPLGALQAATLNPAEYFSATDSLGTIAPGKLADFVFLDANPLVDIYNTRRIRAVVADGRFLDRGTLDQMLIDTEERASRDRAEYRRAQRRP